MTSAREDGGSSALKRIEKERMSNAVSDLLEVFNNGETYKDFRDRVYAEGGAVLEKLQRCERVLEKTDINVDSFKNLAQPVKALVLSEDWCGDCTDNLPVIDKIARTSGKLEMRIVSRDEHLDIMDRFLKNGQFRSIPTVILLDASGNALGHFNERPDSVTKLRASKQQEIHKAHPEFGG